MRRLMPMAALFRQGVLSSCRRRHEWDLDPQRVPISTIPCLIPYATAAVRESTSSFVKMLDTWRWTVRSLRCSSLAIARFALPRAMRRRISISRGVSPCVSEPASVAATIRSS